MKYRAIIGHGEGHISFGMECSRCGTNLRVFADAIGHNALKHCPNCGRKLIQRSPTIKNNVIVEILNATTEVKDHV